MAKAGNLFSHFLVPLHEIVPKENAEKILAKYGASTEKIPLISKADPAVQELEAKKGDLIRITRKSKTAGKTFYYRMVD